MPCKCRTESYSITVWLLVCHEYLLEKLRENEFVINEFMHEIKYLHSLSVLDITNQTFAYLRREPSLKSQNGVQNLFKMRLSLAEIWERSTFSPQWHFWPFLILTMDWQLADCGNKIGPILLHIHSVEFIQYTNSIDRGIRNRNVITIDFLQ